MKQVFDTEVRLLGHRTFIFLQLNRHAWPQYLEGGEIKRDPEMGKTAIQPEPAQTADFSISRSRLISPLCTIAKCCFVLR